MRVQFEHVIDPIAMFAYYLFKHFHTRVAYYTVFFISTTHKSFDSRFWLISDRASPKAKKTI